MVLFMIQAKEVAIIWPASFGSRHEMLSTPVALFGEKGRQRSRARDKKQRRHFFLEEQHENFVTK